MAEQTITLTDRAPVVIDETEWPVIASAFWHDGLGPMPTRADRRANLKVRRHRDGRTIVHGSFADPTGPRTTRRRAGFLLGATISDEDLVTHVYIVADGIGRPSLARDVVAKLPPVRIA